jgi:hypothetical protein
MTVGRCSRYRAGRGKPSHNQSSQIKFRNAGKPRISPTDYRAEITTRGKSSEWSALEKPVAPPLTEFCCLPEIRYLNFVSGLSDAGAGEGI